MTDKILTQTEDGIARIIINHPEKRNAMSLEMWDAIDAAVTRFEADSRLRALILSGAGGKAFASGADISKFESERASQEAVAHYDATTQRVFDRIESFPKPTIAQIDGFCVGGGLALALSCDLRICGEGAQFAIPAAKLGLGYGYSGIKRLVDLVGPSFAKEIFFTARRFDAQEARRMGLVNRVVGDEAVAQTALDTAYMIAENAPMTVASVKFLIGQSGLSESARDPEACARRVKECFDSADYIEGRRAFLEKRKPKFIGA